MYLPLPDLSPVQYKDLTTSIICSVQTNTAKMELLIPPPLILNICCHHSLLSVSHHSAIYSEL